MSAVQVHPAPDDPKPQQEADHDGYSLSDSLHSIRNKADDSTKATKGTKHTKPAEDDALSEQQLNDEDLDDVPVGKLLRHPLLMRRTAMRRMQDIGRQTVLGTVGINDYFMVEEQLLKYLFLFGIFFQLCFAGLFAYFFISNFIALYRTQQFVSVDPESGICKQVTKPWTLPILSADYNGYWEGQKEYQPNQGLYHFNLYDFEADNETYAAWLSKVHADVSRAAELSANYDLSINLLIWSSYQRSETTIGHAGRLQSQTVSFDADAAYIFWSEIVSGTVSDEAADCNINQSVKTYDLANRRLSMHFDMDVFYHNTNCSNAINPHVLGYDDATDGSTFTFSIDVHTLYAALIVAYKINGPDTLKLFQQIDTVISGAWFMGKQYDVQRWYDPMNPQMEPMFCIGVTGEDVDTYNCVVHAGKTYGAPFFQHAGADLTQPVRCNCSTPAGKSPLCDNFDFLTGLLVYNDNVTFQSEYPAAFQPFLSMMEFFYLPPVIGTVHSNEAAYVPAWIASDYGQTWHPKPEYYSPEYRKNMYAFSHTESFGTASLVTFHLTSEYDRGINSHNKQLVDGACNDAFTTPNFHHFYSNPWGSLQEDYYQCTEHLIQAVWSAAGIAQGAAMLFTPLFILVLIYVNVYGIRLMKTVMPTPSAAAAITTDAEAGGEPPAAAAATLPGPAAISAYIDAGSSGLLHAPVTETHKGGHGSGAFVSMGEHLALKDEVDRMRQMLNKYESVWGWEKPFK